MPLPIVFTRRAAREVEEASEWWQANRAGSPDALAVDLADALSTIEDGRQQAAVHHTFLL